MDYEQGSEQEKSITQENAAFSAEEQEIIDTQEPQEGEMPDTLQETIADEVEAPAENGDQEMSEIPNEKLAEESEISTADEITSEKNGIPVFTFSETESASFDTDFTVNSNDDMSLSPENEFDFGIEMPMENDTNKKKRKKPHAVKKGRPRRKKGEGLLGIPNILVTLVWCGLTLLISLTLGRMAWVCAAEVLAFGREDRSVTVTIYENDTIDTITNKLAREGLIHYPGLFKLYAKFAVDDGEIHPGMWDLNTKYDYHALVKMMSPSSSRGTVKVMIPEGYSCRQIFALLEENKVCTAKDIATYAEYGELNDYWFLVGVPRDNKYCLEGFLFPDTYEFYQNDSPKTVLTKMLNNFDKRFDEEMSLQIQTLNNTLADLMRRDGKTQDYINAHLFTVRDVVNVASMIEKETSSAEEGHKIASVIYNRLFYWHGTPAYLNIDATIIYALDGKTDLTSEDLRVDSPYNTYTNIGLTPGPISNPGLSSLQAALQPENTPYYFYVLNPATGSHIFATTQAEHEANRAQVGG